MNEQTRVPTIAELMAEDDHKSARVIIQVAAGALIGVGLVFTGFLNFLLYSHAFPKDWQILGVIPALLIEGSLAIFMLGSFVWFAHGTQGRLARLFGWLMFAIIAGNTLVEFNVLVGSANNQFIDLYAFWAVPLVIPLVVFFWKAVIDSDPAIGAMRQARRLKQALDVAKMDAVLHHLASEQHREALTEYGHKAGTAIDQSLIVSNGKLPAELPNAPSQRKP
jgi:hypothetical protein